MKTISTRAAVLALSICLCAPALAQGRDQQDRAARDNTNRSSQQRTEQWRPFHGNERQARRNGRAEARADRRDDRRDHRWDRRQDRRDHRWDRRQDRRQDARGRPFYAPNHYPPARSVYRGHRAGRGAGPNHNFYRGGRLPPQYRSHYHVVDNWRSHRLSPPPRGYHWVQTGPDYVLAAIATGVILQILLGG